MADVTDLFKGQKFNKMQVGAIVSHVNHLIQNDEDFEELFYSDPVGTLTQFGLTRKISTYLIAEAKLQRELTILPTLKTTLNATKVLLCNSFETRYKDLCILQITKPPKTLTLPTCFATSPTITAHNPKWVIENFPKIDDVKAWSLIASGKQLVL